MYRTICILTTINSPSIYNLRNRPVYALSFSAQGCNGIAYFTISDQMNVHINLEAKISQNKPIVLVFSTSQAFKKYVNFLTCSLMDLIVMILDKCHLDGTMIRKLDSARSLDMLIAVELQIIFCRNHHANCTVEPRNLAKKVH